MPRSSELFPVGEPESGHRTCRLNRRSCRAVPTGTRQDSPRIYSRVAAVNGIQIDSRGGTPNTASISISGHGDTGTAIPAPRYRHHNHDTAGPTRRIPHADPRRPGTAITTRRSRHGDHDTAITTRRARHDGPRRARHDNHDTAIPTRRSRHDNHGTTIPTAITARRSTPRDQGHGVQRPVIEIR